MLQGHSELNLSGASGERRAEQLAASMTPAALPDLSSDTFAAMDRSGLQFGAASSSSGQSDPLAQLTAGHVGQTALGAVVSPPPQLAALVGPLSPVRASPLLDDGDSGQALRAGTRSQIAKLTRTSKFGTLGIFLELFLMCMCPGYRATIAMASPQVSPQPLLVHQWSICGL